MRTQTQNSKPRLWHNANVGSSKSSFFVFVFIKSTLCILHAPTLSPAFYSCTMYSGRSVQKWELSEMSKLFSFSYTFQTHSFHLRFCLCFCVCLSFSLNFYLHSLFCVYVCTHHYFSSKSESDSDSDSKLEFGI